MSDIMSSIFHKIILIIYEIALEIAGQSSLL